MEGTKAPRALLVVPPSRTIQIVSVRNNNKKKKKNLFLSEVHLNIKWQIKNEN